MLMFDEIQSGNGRTGSFFYYQQTGITPEVVPTDKALGNGVPIGACLARGAAAELFAPGHHGSTYGGNPLSCAAALAVLDVMIDEEMPARAPALAQQLLDAFHGSLKHTAAVTEVRHAGLMIGIELDKPCAKLAPLALENRILINVTAGSTLRLLPPLVLEPAQAGELGARLAATVDHWLQNSDRLQGAA